MRDDIENPKCRDEHKRGLLALILRAENTYRKNPKLQSSQHRDKHSNVQKKSTIRDLYPTLALGPSFRLDPYSFLALEYSLSFDHRLQPVISDNAM